MGAIGGLTGTAGGVSGTGIKGPGQANIQQGVTTDQTGQAYQGVQQGLGSQQALLNALQSQNGIGNQASAYSQAQQLQNQLDAARGVQTQNQAIAAQQQLARQQQGLAGQYQNIANGVGPNPAQAMLNQSTGQNVANQAALMAGQRGAGANVGLLARQAAQQGANTQQQAAGQAATMQAQQQLNALQGLGAQQQAIGATNQSVAGIGGSQLAAQQAQQQALAGQAANQVNQQMAGTTGYNQALQSEQGQLLGAMGAQNSAQVGSQGSINAANASNANTMMQGQQGLVGGLTNAAGPALKVATAGLGAKGGDVSTLPHMASGGMMPSSSFGQFLSGWSQPMGAPEAMQSGIQTPGSNAGAESMIKGGSALGQGIADYMNKPSVKNGTMAGPDTGQTIGQTEFTAAEGGLASGGGKVAAQAPDQKAEKPGNSYDNDKIPAMLSEGEVVIPRDVMQSADPISGAAEFVRRVLAKRGKK